MWIIWVICISLAIFVIIIRPITDKKIIEKPKLIVYSKEEIVEYKAFLEILKYGKEVIVGTNSCIIDKKDVKYFYINGKRKRLNIKNYQRCVVGDGLAKNNRDNN